MDQWFVSVDKENLRQKSIEKIESVKFTPDWGANRIRGFLETRPRLVYLEAAFLGSAYPGIF